MKFALIHGDKIESFIGAKGVWPVCGSDAIANVGMLK